MTKRKDYEGKENQKDQKNCATNNRAGSRRKNGKGKGNNRVNPKRNDNNHDDTVNSGISMDNDFAWYNTIPEITRNAARFPFSRPLGTTISYGAADTKARGLISDSGTDFSGTPKTIPGIMAIHWTPTVGISTDPISPLNVTSREIYSFVRHANSGAANYDATDLMIYLIAMDSIYSMYTAAVRAYGLMMMYTKENRYMPAYLVNALGFNFDELKGDLAQFRWAINQIAYKISSFAVPNFMSYYLRHMWMNSGVYTDKPSAKAQMYVFVQDDVFQYDDKINSTTFAGLKSVNISKELPYTVETWLQFMDTLINPILASEDMGIMSGDILKAFGPQNLFTVGPIADDFVLVPSYSPEVLSQIQNLNVVGRVWNEVKGEFVLNDENIFYTSSIIQSIDGENAEGYLIYNPLFRSAESSDPQVVDDEKALSVVTLDKLITSDMDTPDEAAVMVSTRLVNTPSNVAKHNLSTGESTVLIGFKDTAICSTEVVTGVEIITINSSDVFGSYGIVLDTATEKIGVTDITGLISAIVKFDWNPTFPILSRSDSGTVFKGYFQDTNNYTLMSAADLNRLHEAAILSEFYIPQISSATRKPMK